MARARCGGGGGSDGSDAVVAIFFCISLNL